MPSTSRPRGFSGASTSSGRPGPNTPKSERQQMALLMQMTSSNQSDMNTTGHGPARSRDRNERGETALHVAAIKGDQESVKKLLEQGMSPNATDFAGWTPLHEACNHGHYNVALTLVKAGANVNAKGLEDDTPLHDAAILGQMKLVKMLVERGADPGFKNRKGKTPCDVAAAAVYNYLSSARAANRSSSTHQLKKPPDTKKTHTEDEDLMANSGHINTTNTNTNINHNINNSNIVNNLTTMSHTNMSSGGPSSSNIGHTSNIMHSNIISQTAISSHALSNAVNTLTLNPHLNNANSNNLINNTKDDDIYEFKTTPHDTHNKINELKLDNIHNKSVDKMHCDEKLILLDDHNQMISGHHQFIGSHINKRQYGEIDVSDDMLNMTEDESKRKKRKDSDTIIKEMSQNKAATNIRGMQPRQDKNSKIPGPASKTLGLNAKTSTQINSLERKSPCASPKPMSVGKTDSDAENDDGRCDANSERSGGPKVPPLKIVIPQQNNSGDQETGSRNGKNASTRNSALPYVVASSNNESEKEGSSRCNSPVDMLKSSDEKSIKGTSEERAQQRVLRSSHRSGVGGGNGGNGGGNGPAGQPVDRSNNSSPQLHVSSSPSPAFSSSSDTGVTNTQNAAGSNNPSPSNSSHNMNESDVNVNESSPMAASSTSSSSSSNSVNGTNNTQQLQQSNTVELHPRKRKIRASKEDTKTTTTNTASVATINNENQDAVSANSEVHPHDQPITNCYQMHLNIRKQIERRQKSLFPVQPKPPQGFKDYLMNRCSYVLAGKTPSEPTVNYPSNISTIMKEIFTMQEKERHKLKMQHIVEKEKLVLAVEQEILRVHGRAARALANQSLSFSVCTILKDEEVYNMITPEQEEKDRNARSRYNGRLFLSWLQDVDDKWEKIKEEMIFRHHNEAESLHAVQKMDWEWKMKELSLCEYKAKPVIEDTHVPMVHVSDDFDLLPA